MVLDAGHDEVDSPGQCPFVLAEDPQCASRLTLGRLDQAMTICFGRFQTCPMYHRLSRGIQEPFIACTIERIDVAVPLRATGS